MNHSYTSGQAARLCGLGISTIKRWVKRGALNAYRTPGGDLRIRRDHLLDFMREFEIPMHHLVGEGEVREVLVCVDEPGIADLLNQVLTGQDNIRTKCIVNEMDFGCYLVSNKPGYVILQSRNQQEDMHRINVIRAAVNPSPVRVAMISTREIVGYRPECRPEVVCRVGKDEQWVRELVLKLVGPVAESQSTYARRAG